MPPKPTSSSSSDISSSPTPSIMTPTPTSGKKRYLTASPDLDSADEFKPDISDEEDFKPKKSKSNNGKLKTSEVTPKKTSSAGSIGGSAKKAAGYTAQEDWILFDSMRPKTGSPNWAAINQRVGRDSKSCQNRWALLNKKVEGAIKGIGGQ